MATHHQEVYVYFLRTAYLNDFPHHTAQPWVISNALNEYQLPTVPRFFEKVKIPTHKPS